MSEYPTERVLRTDAGSGAPDGGPVIASLTPLAQQYLDQTRPWVRFMSVVTFVSAGLMVLFSLVMLMASAFGGLATNSESSGVPGGAVGRAVMALCYLALACAYVAPGLYLSRYATAIKRLKANGTTAGLEDALKHQKSFWRFAGILTVVCIAVAVVLVGVGIVVGIAMVAARK